MHKVLVIEDDPNLREGLGLLLEIEGYAALGSSNGITGMELIRRQRPDVIITNYKLPGADGFDILSAVREHPELSSTPILFLTADHSPSLRERALQAGVDAFLTKPFQIDTLMDTIDRLLPHNEHEYS